MENRNKNIFRAGLSGRSVVVNRTLAPVKCGLRTGPPHFHVRRPVGFYSYQMAPDNILLRHPSDSEWSKNIPDEFENKTACLFLSKFWSKSEFWLAHTIEV